MGSQHARAASTVDFLELLTHGLSRGEIAAAVEAVRSGEVDAARAARLLSPEATAADIHDLVTHAVFRRAA